MNNKRVFFPIEALALGPHGSASGIFAHGLQDVGMTTSFDLEQILEMGQIESYAAVEALPQVELTIEKALDGYPLVYHLATPDATTNALSNRTNSRCDVALLIFSDEQTSSSGLPITQVNCSGMYVNALTYNLPVDGNFTESVTLVGNSKIWVSGGMLLTGTFTGDDSPLFGEILRRQHVIMGAAPTGSIFPKIIPGMTVANGSGYNVESAGEFVAHLQDINIATSLGRDDLFELGRRDPYYRFATFPTEVTTSIGVTAGGAFAGDGINADPNANNLTDEPIVIKLEDGTVFDLGTKNRLSSVDHAGGGTDGGNVALTYNFVNFNTLTVSHPEDPYVS
jgi:hypothetical protein